MLRDEVQLSVKLLSEARDRTGASLALKDVVVSNRKEIVHHTLGLPGELVDVRSISKVLTCLTIGALLDRKVTLGGRTLVLDSPLLDSLCALPVMRDIDVPGGWESVRLRHLLNNTIGHDEGFLFRKDIGDRSMDSLVSYVFEKPLTHLPGSHFSYSNVGPFLASVLVQESTGRSLGSWAEELILSPLGVRRFEWKKYGEYDAGCSGLCISAEDMHKLGWLILEDGIWGDERLVSQQWVSQMRSPLTHSPEKFEPHRALPKLAYGLGLWICPNGAYYCDGTDGQYLIVLPYSSIVISITGAQSDMKPISECFRNLIYPDADRHNS